MKTEYKIIGVAVVCGLFFWLSDALLDYLLFYKKLFTAGPISILFKQEISVHSLWMLLVFIIFGIIVARLLLRHKHIEDSLQQALERFHRLSEASFEGIVIHEKGKILELNQALAEMFGYEHQELLGRSGFDLVTPESRKVLMEQIGSGSDDPYEAVGVKKDGTTFPIEIHGKTAIFEGHTVRVGAVRDISERKRAEEEQKRNYQKLKETLEGTIAALAATVESRDLYTSGHQKRVAKLAVAIAKQMNLSEEQIFGVRLSALIHDIGKIAVPLEILNKPGKLSEDEFAKIEVHSQVAYEILKKIEFPWPIAQVVAQHHERLNGSGYPKKLSGEEIQLEARILSVADVVEAMASVRPYRPALGIEKALEEITAKKGVLYDSKVVEACVKIFKEIGFTF